MAQSHSSHLPQVKRANNIVYGLRPFDWTLYLMIVFLVWLGLQSWFPGLASKRHLVFWLGSWCYRSWPCRRQIWPQKCSFSFTIGCTARHICNGFCQSLLDRRSLSFHRRNFWGWLFPFRVRYSYWAGWTWEANVGRDNGLVLFHGSPNDSGTRGLFCS